MMVGEVCCLLNDANEVVVAVIIVWVVHVERVKDFAECGEIIIGGLVCDWWE